MKLRRHACPRRGCSEIVPDRLFACRVHWFELSADTRAQIIRTRNRHVLDPERRAAFEAARVGWEAA